MLRRDVGRGTTVTQRERSLWLNRLRFPAQLEASFQHDYFQRARSTMRAGSVLGALLMVPTAAYNESIGFRDASLANGFLALVALSLFLAVSHRAGARLWKPAMFIAAALAAAVFDWLNVTRTPHLPHITSVAHALTVFLLVKVVILVFAFVIARFTLRWYLAYAVFSLAGGIASVALWLPGGLLVLLRDSSYSLVPAVAMLGLLAYRQERSARAEFLANHLLEAEHARAEGLLLNVLPGPIAERLKASPGAITDDFEEVGVLFADIVDFTSLAARLPATEVVRLLNEVFTAFDELAERHGLEKIKTIGDAYMAVAGLPEPKQDHAAALAEMALGMREAAARFDRDNGAALELRIGINVGPVVAGVIGTKKFIYDLWGDTVNIASRMESQGLPGTVQCTEAAYRLLRDRYEFAGPFPVPVKGRGELPVYRLLGKRASRSQLHAKA